MVLLTSIITGASLAGTTIGALTGGSGSSVSCGIETENWSKFPMTDSMIFVHTGQIKIPPYPIQPGEKEAMLAHKTGGSYYGTFGAVSWLIKDRRVVVMWSIPFTYWTHSNWMAVGITKPGYTEHDPDWHHIMYSKGNTSNLSFKRKEFYYDMNAVVFSDGDFTITATIGSTYKSTAHVQVKPVDPADYARSIKQAQGE